MNNSVSGNLGPKKVETNNKSAAPIQERDITEEIRLKSVFDKTNENTAKNRGAAPDGKKIADEARKKYDGYNSVKTGIPIDVNKNSHNNEPKNIFGND